MVGLVEQQAVARRFVTTLGPRIKEWLIHNVDIIFRTKQEAGDYPRRKEKGCIAFRSWGFVII